MFCPITGEDQCDISLRIIFCERTLYTTLPTLIASALFCKKYASGSNVNLKLSATSIFSSTSKTVPLGTITSFPTLIFLALI